MDPRLPPAAAYAAVGRVARRGDRVTGREGEAPCPSARASCCGAPCRCATPRDGRRARSSCRRSCRRRWRGARARCASATRSSARPKRSRTRSRRSTSRSTSSRRSLILFGAVWLVALPRAADHHAAAARRARAPSGSRPGSAACGWTSRRAATSSARSSPRSTGCPSGWPAARRRSSITRAGLTRKNQELEERRRLTETVLETVGTGVVVVDPEGTLTARERRARAACSTRSMRGAQVGGLTVLKGRGARRSSRSYSACSPGRVSRQEREVSVPAARRDRHLAVTVVPLPGPPAPPPGRSSCSTTSRRCMRAQKVAAWGEVAQQARARDQEPADADPALGAAHAQGVR